VTTGRNYSWGGSKVEKQKAGSEPKGVAVAKDQREI